MANQFQSEMEIFAGEVYMLKAEFFICRQLKIITAIYISHVLSVLQCKILYL